MPEGSAAYEKAVSTVTAQMETEEKEFLDFVCYDVYFEVDGEKVEPEAGSVMVTIQYKQPQFKAVVDEATEFATYHIIGDTNVVEDVTESICTDSSGAVTSVGFSTESFSVITTVALKSYKDADEGDDAKYKQDTYKYNNFGLGTTNNGVHDHYNNVGTSYFEVTINGNVQVGYCVQSLYGTTDSDGNVSTDRVKELLQQDESDLQKVLYYGYEGPGDASSSFFTVELLDELYKNQSAYIEKIKSLRGDAEANAKDHSGLLMTAEQYNQLKSVLQMSDSDATKQSFYYVMTHMAASMAYFNATGGHGAVSYIEAGAWGTNAVGMALAESWYNYLKEIARPEISFQVSGNTVKLVGQPETVRMTIQVPEGLEYTFDGNVYTAGKSFAMAPGQSFTFQKVKMLASEPFSNLNYKYSGTAKDINGNLLSGSWSAVVVDGGGKQDVGALSYTDTIELTADFEIDWKQGHFKLTKVDESGNVIKVAGAEFEVYADEAGTTKLGTVVTNSDGIAEGYVSYSGTDSKIYLKEVAAPLGYQLDGTIIEVDVANEAALNVTHVNTTLTGGFRLEKLAEILKSAETDENGTTFIYEESALENAVFGLYAEENIYAPYDASVLVYEKDQLIASMTTDTDGFAGVDGLVVGKYYVKELETPLGFVFDSDISYSFELQYDETATQVINVEMTGDAAIKNARQKINIYLVKKDSKNPDKTLAGAKFALYTAEDIVVNGEIILAKDTLVNTAVSGENGIAVLGEGLPLGKYYAKEIAPPAGYEKSDEIVYVDASEPDSEDEVVEFYIDYVNDPTPTTVKTGDTSDTFTLLLLLAISAAVISVIVRKRKMIYR